MKNEITLKIRLLDDKQIKKGNWEIRVWNLLCEYFKVDHLELSWSPTTEWEAHLKDV